MHMRGNLDRNSHHILVADDDKLIRSSILAQLRQIYPERHAFYEAYDGRTALQQLSENPIGIVLTDMRMPHMDGLQLIEAARQQWPSVQFAVLSNYDDFDYVKHAFGHGIVDYVLKYELEAPMLKGLVEKATASLNAFLHQQVWQAKMQRSSLHENALRLGAQVADAIATCAVPAFLPRDRHRTLRLLRVNCLPTRDAGADWRTRLGEWWAAALEADGRMDVHPFILPQGPDRFRMELGLFISMQFANRVAFDLRIDDLLRDFFAYATAQRCIAAGAMEDFEAWDIGLNARLNGAADLLFYCDECAIFPVDAVGEGVHSAADLYPLFSSALMEGRAEDAHSLLNRLTATLRKGRVPPQAAQHILGRLFWEIQSVAGPITPVSQLSQLRLSTYAASIARAIESLPKREARETGGASASMDELIAHLTSHLSTPISLDDAARSIGFSRAHFCRLFKQATGESFNSYMTKKRLEQACILLRKPKAQPRMVASAIGISDVRYFRKLFYQHMHVDIDAWMKGETN